MNSHVQHFTKNELGRDFVVGDIHGCFDMLRLELEAVAFDESCDRLFSVGDLVDRGPDSVESIDWIAKPWFHPVRGNHEQMAIGVAAGRHNVGNYLLNGGGWFLALPDDRQKLFADVFSSLPYTLDVETDAGLVGIVHAECCGPSWPAFLDALDNPPSNNKLRHAVEVALWSRERVTHRDCSRVDGVDVVIVGHTPVSRVGALGNVLYVDTGAVFGGALSVIDMATITAEAA